MQLTESRMHLAYSFPDPEKSSQIPYHTSCNYILIVPVHLPLGLPSSIYDSFPTKTPYTPHTSTYVPHATSSLIFLFYHQIIAWWRVQILQLFILRSFLQSPFPSSLLGPTYSQTFSSPCFSLNWRDQVSHPHKKTKKYFPFCTQIYRCHEMFPGVRWMFTEWGFLNQSSSRYKIKRTHCGRSTVIS